MPRESVVTRALREMVAHLERAELTLGEVRVSGPELVKANAAFEDVRQAQRWLAEMEIHAHG